MGQERKRRQRGDGGLFQRGNGLWFASVDLGYTDGKRVRREVSSKTMAGARAKANAVREEGGWVSRSSTSSARHTSRCSSADHP